MGGHTALVLFFWLQELGLRRPEPELSPGEGPLPEGDPLCCRFGFLDLPRPSAGLSSSSGVSPWLSPKAEDVLMYCCHLSTCPFWLLYDKLVTAARSGFAALLELRVFPGRENPFIELKKCQLCKILQDLPCPFQPPDVLGAQPTQHLLMCNARC